MTRTRATRAQPATPATRAPPAAARSACCRALCEVRGDVPTARRRARRAFDDPAWLAHGASERPMCRGRGGGARVPPGVTIWRSDDQNVTLAGQSPR